MSFVDMQAGEIKQKLLNNQVQWFKIGFKPCLFKQGPRRSACKSCYNKVQ